MQSSGNKYSSKYNMEFIVLKTQKIINACSSILMLCPLKNVNENINIFPTEHRLLNTKSCYISSYIVIVLWHFISYIQLGGSRNICLWKSFYDKRMFQREGCLRFLMTDIDVVNLSFPNSFTRINGFPNRIYH